MLIIGGTLTNYMKTMQLTQKAQRRMAGLEQTKKWNVGEESAAQRQIEQMKETMVRQREAEKLAGVMTKLQTGQELSDNDLAVLKEKNPMLYQKALGVMQERREYKRRLGQCRTKDEVRRLNLQSSVSFAGEVKQAVPAGGQGGHVAGVGMRMEALRNEHIAFLQTRRYAQLPMNQDELRRKRKAQGGGAGERQRRQLYIEVHRLDFEMQKKLAELEHAAQGRTAEQPAQDAAKSAEEHKGGATDVEGGVVNAAGGVAKAAGGVVKAAGGVAKAEGGVAKAAGGVVNVAGGGANAAGTQPSAGTSTPAHTAIAPSVPEEAAPAAPAEQPAMRDAKRLFAKA